MIVLTDDTLSVNFQFQDVLVCTEQFILYSRDSSPVFRHQHRMKNMTDCETKTTTELVPSCVAKESLLNQPHDIDVDSNARW